MTAAGTNLRQSNDQIESDQIRSIRHDVWEYYTEEYAQQVLNSIKPYEPIPGTNGCFSSQVCDYFFDDMTNHERLFRFVEGRKRAIRPFTAFNHMSTKKMRAAYEAANIPVPSNLVFISSTGSRIVYSPKDMLMLAIIWRDQSDVADALFNVMAYNAAHQPNHIPPENLPRGTKPQVFRATMIQVEGTITPPAPPAPEVPAQVPSTTAAAEDKATTPQVVQEPSLELVLSKLVTLLEKIEQKGVTISLAA